ncbi:MAG TPA: flagellar basal body-associated protein FliL [Bacillota bacterium]|nr:flagellar basal body-associated protein FliL [Bacillota bacterium]
MRSTTKVMMTSLIVILLLGIMALLMMLYVTGDEAKGESRTIEDMVEYSHETPEITTDLEDGSFVRIQFQIITDSKEAKEEISKRDFQLKNILIKELATMDEDDFKEGLGDLEEALKLKLNELMTDGTVTDVYTINKILQ